MKALKIRTTPLKFALIALFAAFSVAAATIPPDSRLFIAPMDGHLDGFIAAEIIKQKVPLKVVMEEKDAEYVLTGMSIKADDKWYHVAFGGKDKNEGNVRLVNVQEKTMVWAGEAGDRSMLYGGWKRGGERKVSSRIVEKMRKELFGKHANP